MTSKSWRNISLGFMLRPAQHLMVYFEYGCMWSYKGLRLLVQKARLYILQSVKWRLRNPEYLLQCRHTGNRNTSSLPFPGTGAPDRGALRAQHRHFEWNFGPCHIGQPSYFSAERHNAAIQDGYSAPPYTGPVQGWSASSPGAGRNAPIAPRTSA